MFTLAYTLASIIQWTVFLTILAILTGLAMLVARLVGIGKRGRRITGLAAALIAFVLLNVQLNQFVSGKYLAHLCRTEAGTFIERAVDNVEGFYLIRVYVGRDIDAHATPFRYPSRRVEGGRHGEWSRHREARWTRPYTRWRDVSDARK